MDTVLKKNRLRKRRRTMGVRKKLRGNADKLRLCFCKSNRYLFVQALDDEKGKTLLGLSTSAEQFRKKDLGKNKEAAEALGQEFAKLALEKGLKSFVFDRGPRLYHKSGVLATFVEVLRTKGLQV